MIKKRIFTALAATLMTAAAVAAPQADQALPHELGLGSSIAAQNYQAAIEAEQAKRESRVAALKADRQAKAF